MFLIVVTVREVYGFMLLSKLFPKARLDLLQPLQSMIDSNRNPLTQARFTPLRLIHFLAQLAHESDGFKTVEEYASGKAYEGRKDLGNTSVGDGIKYKGRGFVQITGNTNYKQCAKFLGIDIVKSPEKLLIPDLALEASIWFWESRALDFLADKNDLKGITKKINGGYNGLTARQAYFNLLWRNQ